MTPLKPSFLSSQTSAQASDPTDLASSLSPSPGSSSSSSSSPGSGISFPLACIVAIAGSRYGSPYPIAPVVNAIHQAGGSIRVGCAKGVDQAVRKLDPSCMVVSVHGYLPAKYSAALALRTRAVIEKAHSLILYPPASNSLGPGSYLALSTAIEHTLPVFCAGIKPTKANWQPYMLAGVSGFVLVPQQNTLFST